LGIILQVDSREGDEHVTDCHEKLQKSRPHTRSTERKQQKTEKEVSEKQEGENERRKRERESKR
jgi:hypothetical protein